MTEERRLNKTALDALKQLHEDDLAILGVAIRQEYGKDASDTLQDAASVVRILRKHAARQEK
jgi:hypothetical protein